MPPRRQQFITRIFPQYIPRPYHHTPKHTETHTETCKYPSLYIRVQMLYVYFEKAMDKTDINRHCGFSWAKPISARFFLLFFSFYFIKWSAYLMFIVRSGIVKACVHASVSVCVGARLNSFFCQWLCAYVYLSVCVCTSTAHRCMPFLF